MMKMYVVKKDTCDYDKGFYNGTVVVGYYLNKDTADKVAAEIKPGICTLRGYVDEIEVNED